MSREARLLFLCVYLLTGFGIVMTYSSSAIFADKVYGNAQFFLVRQVIFVLIGTLGLFVAAALPVTFMKSHARAIILAAIALMVMVFVPVLGKSAGGAQRWIRLGVVNLQPVEFAKIAVCIYLCDYLTRKIKYIERGSIQVFVPPFVLIGVLCGLSLLQPDLGSCFFIVMISAILFFLAGIRIRYVFAALAFFIPVFYFLIVRVPYRMSRLMAYLNPWEDPQGGGFQIIQSFLAFGLGGIHGTGLGASTQKLFYLPSSYTDFIFAVIGEELGMIGVVSVILLYAVIFVCGLRMAWKARYEFDKLLITALTLFIVLQALLNMLVSTGLIPTKGMPLPFISYGGTSVVFNLMAVGLLVSLDRHRFRRF